MGLNISKKLNKQPTKIKATKTTKNNYDVVPIKASMNLETTKKDMRVVNLTENMLLTRVQGFNHDFKYRLVMMCVAAIS